MADITRWDPFGEMLSLRQAMDRLLEESFVSPSGMRQVGAAVGGFPPVDIHETGDEVVVTAALPGVTPDDVEMTITGQTLTIRGELKPDEDADRYLYRERRYGAFGRQFQLPVRIQGDAAEASFENGLLTLRIPKAEEVRPRQIRISSGQSASGGEPTSGGGTGA
jgi:HSP20 family protein